MAKIVDLQHKWAHEIGRIFIAFGSMEWSVNLMLHTVPADPIHAATNRLPLSQKLDLLIDILTDRLDVEEGTLINVLRRMKTLSEGRNLIAHNPLVLDIYMSEDNSEVAYQEVIASQRKKNKHLSFDDVVKLREDSERLGSDLISARLAFERSGRANVHRLLNP